MATIETVLIEGKKGKLRINQSDLPEWADKGYKVVTEKAKPQAGPQSVPPPPPPPPPIPTLAEKLAAIDNKQDLLDFITVNGLDIVLNSKAPFATQMKAVRKALKD